MPQTCSICGHAQRTAIEQAIAAGKPLRAIARQFGTTHHALARHRDHCGALAIADARQDADAVRQSRVREELDVVLARMRTLFDACDRYLRDPDQPAQYDLGPRAGEVTVIYLDGETIRKARLSTLLMKIGEHTSYTIMGHEWRVADPRKLVLSTATVLSRQIELLAKLTGELDERPQVNILVHPDWLRLRDAILDALEPHPAALEEVRRAIGQLSG